MRKIIGALVMLCGLVLVNGLKAQAQAACTGVEIKMLKNEIDIFINGDEPNYLSYIAVVDYCGNEISYPKEAVKVNNYQVDTKRLGVYKVLISLLLGDYHDVKTLYVNVKDDLTPPDITGVHAKYFFTLNTPLATSLFLHPDLKAIDNRDGDVTNLIDVDYTQVNPGVTGKYPVFFTAQDKNDNKMTVKADVYIVDSLPELITNLSDYTLEVYSPVPDFTSGLIVYSDYEKTAVLELDTSQLKLNELGLYEVKIKAKFYNLEEEKIIKVRVIDTAPPVIEGAERINLKKGEKVNLSKYFTVTDNYDENPKMFFTGHLDVKKTGTYILTATAKDSSGNIREITFQVLVERTASKDYVLIAIIGTIVFASGAALTIYLVKQKKKEVY